MVSWSILGFRLLRPFQVFSLEIWFFSPLLIVFIISCGLGINYMTNGDDDENLAYSLFALSILFLLLYIIAILWAKHFPRVPGEHKKFKIHPNDPFNAPKAYKQVVLSEVTAKNTKYFLDKQNRRCFLRGVNFSGINKVPSKPFGSSFDENSLNDPKNVSFVGRPCPISELDLHLSRLRAWGLTFFRLLITWEAVEHEGPGIYDEEYLEYLLALVKRCADFGISVFIDPHQDVWSRFTGGDGAPAWTLELVGFDISCLCSSDCALTQQHLESIGKGGEYGRMHWNSNHRRLATATMWTIFFGGNDFTTSLKIKEESAQDYLRRHYINMLKVVATKLKDCDNVLGFDTLNEPSTGFIRQTFKSNSKNIFWLGYRPTVWQTIQCGIGIPQKVPYFKRFAQFSGIRTMNKDKICVWSKGKETCVWLKEGLYTWQGNRMIPSDKANDYFKKNPITGEEVDIMKDYALPFFQEVAEALREIRQDYIIFTEPILDFENPMAEESLEISEEQVGNGFVWAKHWYEPSSIIMQKFRKYIAIGPKGIPTFNLSSSSSRLSSCDAKVLKEFKDEANNSPTLIGETGIPFNMIPSPFKSNDFRQCSYALNTMLDAHDKALLSYTLWNYCPINENKFGDHWNKEDFSIFSLSQITDETDLNSGGRSLDVIVRPYPLRVAGKPTKISFKPYSRRKTFTLEFEVDQAVTSNETIIFLPQFQYHSSKRITVQVTSGRFDLDWENQTLLYFHDITSDLLKHKITVELNQ